MELVCERPLIRDQLKSGGYGLAAARTRTDCGLVRVGNSRDGRNVPSGRLRGRSAAYSQRGRRGRAGSSFVERNTVNTGTVPDLARLVRCQRAGGAGCTDSRSVRDGAEPP